MEVLWESVEFISIYTTEVPGTKAHPHTFIQAHTAQEVIMQTGIFSCLFPALLS